MSTVNRIVAGMTGCALFLTLAVLGVTLKVGTKPETANAVSTWIVVKQGQFGIYCDKNLSIWPNLCSPKHTFTSTIFGNSAVKLAYTVATGHCASVRAHVLVDGVEKGVTTYMGHYGTLASASRPKTYTVELGTLQSGSHEFSLMGELDGFDCAGGNAGLANWGGDFVLSAEQTTTTTPFIACSSNSQCGTDGYVDSPVCSGNSVYQNYKTWTCLNPGTASSFCQPNTVQQLKNNCSSNQTCQAGACVTLGTIACSSNNDCQATTYGSNYCSANTTIYRSKTSFNCMNPGQTSSYCQPNTIQEFQSICYGNQTCQSGSCVTNNTNTYNPRSYQQCYNNAVWWYDSNNSRQDVAQYCNSNQYCSGNICVNQVIYYPPYNPPVYTNLVYGNMQVIVQVRNLSSGNLNWSSSASASPSDVVQYSISIKNSSGQNISNLTVRDILPANLYFYNNVTVDGTANSGNIASGINIGPLSANQTRTVMYQAQVAPAQNFNFGITTLTNSVTLASTDSGFNNPGIASAPVAVTRSGVLGATTVSTGLTNNPWLDSFFLPLVLALLALWAYKSGVLNSLGFAGTRTSANTKLQSKIAQIKEKETV